MYTVSFADAVNVLYCFKKKSTQGREAPKPDMDLIRTPLQAAARHAKDQRK